MSAPTSKAAQLYGAGHFAELAAHAEHLERASVSPSPRLPVSPSCGAAAAWPPCALCPECGAAATLPELVLGSPVLPLLQCGKCAIGSPVSAWRPVTRAYDPELRRLRDKANRLERQNYWFRLNSGLLPRKPRQVPTEPSQATTKHTKHTKE